MATAYLTIPKALILAAVLAAASPHGPAGAAIAGSAGVSPWVQSHASRARLIAGGDEPDGGRLAGVEIELDKGWKTYWRTPGDAGGVPPSFDWSASKNAGTIDVLYPAPRRLSDKAGDTIGYKERVVFPVKFRPPEPGKPIVLAVTLSYGVCKDICIPVESSLNMPMPDAAADETAALLSAAVENVPRADAGRRAGDPVLTKVEADLGGKAPTLRLTGKFPGGAAAADMFIEGPGGIYLPMPVKVEQPDAGTAVFAVDLSSDVDLAQIKGKAALVTLVGARGQSTAGAKIE